MELSSVDLLRSVVDALPADDPDPEVAGHADELAAAALASLTDPLVAAAAAHEAAIVERLAQAAPHVVHTPDPYRTTPDVFAADGGMIERGGRAYVGPADCPDCTRGLVAIEDGFMCSQLRFIGYRTPEDRIEQGPCHDGCLVACGRER